MCSWFMIPSSAAFLVQVIWKWDNSAHLISSSFKIPKWDVSDIGTHSYKLKWAILTWSVHSHIEDFSYCLINLRCRKMLFSSYVLWVTHGYDFPLQESVTNPPHLVWHACRYLGGSWAFPNSFCSPIVLKLKSWNLITSHNFKLNLRIPLAVSHRSTGWLEREHIWMAEWCYVMHVFRTMICPSLPSVCFLCY